MKEFLIKISHKKSAVIIFCAALIVIALVIHSLTGGFFSAGGDDDNAGTQPRVNPSVESIKENVSVPAETATAATVTTTMPTAGTTSSSTAATTAPSSSVQPTTVRTVPFATAIPPQNEPDYNAQWELGYLVAIDNPDTVYSCPHIELTDEDRDLLERLCMGEFGSGGFIGAALIAQSVKDAMCFDGYATVEDVIKYCRYDGDTNRGTNADCVRAVRYVFDDDGDVVQHRIMYMYNPYLVQSAFHESQNYILSYQGVRFFDRWGY